VQRFYLRKLSGKEVRKKYQINISNRFAAFENLNDSEGINRAWKNNEENIKTSNTDSLGLYGLKQHKPYFDKKMFTVLDQRKQAKIQGLKDTNQSHVDNLNNVRRKDR